MILIRALHENRIHVQTIENFVSSDEESRLVQQIEKWLEKKHYEGGHFDKVISHYRELQKPFRFFSAENKLVLERIKERLFPTETKLLPVHILDLAAEGEIGSHVDHTDYSGRFIIGLSLLSDVVMTFRHESSGTCVCGIVLSRASSFECLHRYPSRTLSSTPLCVCDDR